MPRIERIKLPESENIYDVGANGAYAVAGTQQSATSSWTGILDAVGGLEDGLTIAYYLPYTSSGDVTLALTINDTPTDAIPVYYTGTTRMNSQYTAGSTILLTYYSAGAISIDGTPTETARWTSADSTAIQPSSTVSDVSTVSGSAGVSTEYSRGDHTHKLEVSTAVEEDDTKPVTSGAVFTAIKNIPSPMIFKGSVGDAADNPTVTWDNLPAASSTNEGFTYKVISDHATAPICKAGDSITSDGTNWVVFPSGDEPSGTVTNVATGVGLTGGPVTSSGTVKADLVSETPASSAATQATEVAGRLYATQVDSNGKLATVVPWVNTTYSANNTNIKQVNVFTKNTPTAVTLPTYTVQDRILTIGGGSVTAGTQASLSTITTSVTTGISAN